jgi:carboxyl-terminal processing protease
MNREKIAWTVSVLLIAILAFQLPHGMAQRDNDYAFVRTLVDIHRQVANNYVESVDESKLEQSAINGMLGQLDPFSVYVPPANQEEFDQLLEGNFKGVGIQLNQRDDGRVEVLTPIDGSPAFKAGIQAGDLVLKVNGESIEGLKLTPDILKKIKGPIGTPVTLTVLHEGDKDPVDITMTREEVVVPMLKGYSRKPDNSWDYYVSDDPKIAYVRLVQFTPETHDKLKEVLDDLLKDGMRGLVFDLRWNPGGRLDEAVKIVNLFIDKGVIVSTKGRNRPERIERASPNGTLPYFPMVVLVNEHSASASEIVSGSLEDNHRALVVGTRTYGKGSVQELIPLEGGTGELKLTVAYYYLPSGRLVHRKKDATDWGVEPQIAVPMDEPAQIAVFKQISEHELFHRPKPKMTTRPATTRSTSTTAAATQPVIDSQLKAGVDSLRSFIIFQGNRGGDFVAMAPAAAATQPSATTTQPSTRGATTTHAQ